MLRFAGGSGKAYLIEVVLPGLVSWSGRVDWLSSD
jgi:hypothetical protein